MKLLRAEHKRLLKALYGAEGEDYGRVLEAISLLLETSVLPHSKEFDEAAGGIAPGRRALFDQGICRLAFPSAEGTSLPFGVYAMAMELVASADAPTAMSIGIHNTVAEGVFRFGNDDQRKRVFTDLVEGRRLGAFALTEPSSGSDARAMKTTAVKNGSNYTLDGSKMFITNAGDADIYLVFAASAKGHSAFIVDKSTPGLSVGKDIPKLGMRGSRTAEVRFSDCSVPAGNLVGKEGEAFEYVKFLLSGSRIVMGSICVGIALTAYRKALEYSKQRSLFNGELSELQMTREKIADMRTELSSSRLLCAYASRLKDAGVDFSSEAAQAKVAATESAVRVCDRAIQLFGGYGYTDPDVHRHWRDARLLTIGEGASEVLRMLIAGKELAETR
ncbi:MAG: acyl-CoA dehydrogenase family protein [Thaumarchaeota archaeon]|nr:acyl-CoA dehydrogenase family protein [Nitrososphaerota archaeon]